MTKNHVLLESLRVQIPPRVLRRDATTGTGLASKTSDPRERTGGSNVSVPLRSSQNRRPPDVVRPLTAFLWRRVLTGRQPVPNTGDPKGFGGSNPPVFAYKPLWQNWQMHLPAKQGPVDPASGVGTRERRSSREQLVFLVFSKNL